MSIVYCDICDKNVDLDFHSEHKCFKETVKNSVKVSLKVLEGGKDGKNNRIN